MAGRPKKEVEGKYIVVNPFQDRAVYGSDKYEVGDDVSHFDADRLESAISRKLVELNVTPKTEE